jgi:hypothetical protein
MVHDLNSASAPSYADTMASLMSNSAEVAVDSANATQTQSLALAMPGSTGVDLSGFVFDAGYDDGQALFESQSLPEISYKFTHSPPALPALSRHSWNQIRSRVSRCPCQAHPGSVNAKSEEGQKVFDEIVSDHALHLMNDVFGNYVCG